MVPSSRVTSTNVAMALQDPGLQALASARKIFTFPSPSPGEFGMPDMPATSRGLRAGQRMTAIPGPRAAAGGRAHKRLATRDCRYR